MSSYRDRFGSGASWSSIDSRRLAITFDINSPRPVRRYPHLWIWRPSPERQWDLNPPELGAAQHTLSADSDFSPPIAPRFVSFARHYLRFALFAPPGSDDPPRTWTTSTAASAPPHHGGENETSQVPGRPLPTCPPFRPRRTAVPQANTEPAMWSSVRTITSTPHYVLSRLYHAACTLSVYAS